MNNQQFNNLNVGDIVRSNPTGLAYIVTQIFGDRITAVRSVDITNPIEWELVRKNEQNH